MASTVIIGILCKNDFCWFGICSAMTVNYNTDLNSPIRKEKLEDKGLMGHTWVDWYFFKGHSLSQLIPILLIRTSEPTMETQTQNAFSQPPNH